MKSLLATALAITVVIGGATRAGAEATAAHPRVAQALELARVWLEAQRAYEQIPGVSAAVVHDQQVLWAGGYGWADIAARRPAAADTIYSICSISGAAA